MDPNKAKVLNKIQYMIMETCDLCVHAQFDNSDWGICHAHKYEHQKHSENPRQLSIHKSGRCDIFEISQSKKEEISHFLQVTKDGKALQGESV